MRLIALFVLAGSASVAVAGPVQAPALQAAGNIGQPNTSVHPMLVSALANPELFTVRTPGDTISAAPLVQDGTAAFYLDTAAAPGTFTMGGAAGLANPTGGGNALYQTSTGYMFTRSVVNGNSLFVQVNYFSRDAAGNSQIWVPGGAMSPNAIPFTSWRLDVGALAGGANGIDLNAPIESILQSGQTAWNSAGNNLGTFGLAVNNAVVGGTSLSGAGVIGLGGANVAGFDFVEQALFWEVVLVPAPSGLALLGLGGLLAARRRR